MAGIPARRLTILALIAVAALPSYALTVGVVPAEGEAYASPPDGSGSPIRYLVSGCLSALFDAGYVATEASVSRIARASWGPAAFGLAEAREGMVDYVIALYVEWTPSSFYKSASLPVTVEYRLVRIRDGKVIAEGNVSGPSDSESAASHEARTAAQTGASAALSCLRTLSTLAMGGE